MIPSRLFVSLLLLAMAGLSACGGAVVLPGRLVFVPLLPADAKKWTDQVPPELSSPTTVSIRPGPFTVTMVLLDDAERTAFLTKALGRKADPFGPVAGSPQFVTVRMDVRNESKEEMTFNPQQIILVTDSPDYIEPLDATRLHEGLPNDSEAADAFLTDMHRALYDTSVMLRQGESVSRLLVIPFPRHSFKHARLECALFMVGRRTFSFDVPLAPVFDTPTSEAPAPVTPAPEAPADPADPAKQSRRTIEEPRSGNPA
jgi:hypothetical protein